MNLESCAFTQNRCLVIGKKNPVTRKVSVVSTLQTFRLKACGCELTVMPLGWVLGRDRNSLQSLAPKLKLTPYKVFLQRNL